MKAILGVFVSALFLVPAISWSAVPEQVSKEAYTAWLEEIGSVTSPYLEFAFDWHEAQKNLPLPAEVDRDPERLFVTVDRPLQNCIRLEGEGEIEKGVTYGLETYGILDASVAQVLETVLFRWGKPVGAAAGVTYPFDTIYGFREERLAPEWGPGNFKTFTKKTRGGIAKDMHDAFSLLVRGNEQDGYLLVGSFFNAFGPTATTSYITVVMIKPMADGRTEYRVTGYQMGQSYAFFGIENGRKNFGFNASRIRDGQKEFFAQVQELKRTGKIAENKSNPLM